MPISVRPTVGACMHWRPMSSKAVRDWPSGGCNPGVDDVLANELESTAAISNADGDTVAAAWALEYAAALSSAGEDRERRLSMPQSLTWARLTPMAPLES